MSIINYFIKTFKLNKGLLKFSIQGHIKIYKEWRDQVDSHKTPLEMELPWITLISKNYIESFLNQKKDDHIRIFEYGSGGSSLFFLKYAKEVFTVEHDETWYELVKETINKKKIIGWTGFLLKPEIIKSPKDLDISNPLHYFSNHKDFFSHSFQKYVSIIDKFPNDFFDLILVDGRSRPSCLLHSISKIKSGGLLVLDNAEREYYLKSGVIKKEEFTKVVSINSALICYNSFTQTIIYIKK